MKKLMIAAALIAMAVSAQASTVNWACYADQDITGYNIYLVTQLAEYTSEAAIGNLLGTGGNKAIAGEYGWSYGNEGIVQGLTAKEGDMVDFYYVIVKGDSSGYWTKSSSAQAYDTSASHIDADDDVTTLMGTAATAWKTPGPTPTTPEPTSAMLMLLGVAGLALRRKAK